MNDSVEENFLPEIYNLVFHNNVCHVCKEMEQLTRCSQCKIVAYCSKRHQKIDWKFHKKFCYAMANVRGKLEKIEISNFEQFVALRTLRYQLLKKELGRELKNFEMDMWKHPRFCEVCFSETVQLNCPKCRNVFFCSENHRSKFQEQHEKNCDELKLCLEIDMSLFRSGLGNTNFEASDISNNIKKLPSTIADLLVLYDKNSKNDTNIKQQILKIQCISPVASILFGLEKCGILKDRLFHKSDLNVHIVGGNWYEQGLLWKEMIELAFHWITNITKLEYIIIGPELEHNDTTDKFNKQLCKTCKSRNVTTKLTFHSQLYHNIVNQLKKPDVVVCFNSGLHVNSTKSEDLPEYVEPEHQWEDSIKYLIKDGVLLILTAYTLSEIVPDIEEIKKFAKNVDILVEPQKNPFYDVKPNRDLASQVNPVYFTNGYISVLTSRS